MEKRLILFFFLVALTMILFQQFVYPPRPTNPSPTVSSETLSGPPLAETPAAPEAARADEGFMDGVAPAAPETAVVKTDYLVLTVVSVGAAVVSCELPKYAEADGRPVRLFPDAYPGGATLTVNRGEDRSLASTPFRMEVEPHPSQEHAARIVWTATRHDGGWLRKTLEVPREGYACRLRVESRGLGLAGYRIEFPPGMRSTERNVRDDRSYFAAMAGIAGRTWKQEAKRLKATATAEGPMRWTGVRTKYFIVAMVPDSASWHRVVAVADHDGHLGISAASLALGGNLDVSYHLYMGPLDYERLAPLGGGIVHAIEMGNKYLRPIGRLVLLFLTTVHKAIPNYGIVIILFAITMKVLLQPLTASSMKSMQKMQELQPKLAAIKEKYKNNPQKQQQETMKLYKEHGINPLGGCLPMLVQMPIFFAMYPVLRGSIHLRSATFIPGIVPDLSQPNIILPILMGITQFISGKMMATDKQNKALAYMMPIFMTYIFFSLPSGLVLYWLTFNVLQIAQQVWQRRRMAVKAAS